MLEADKHWEQHNGTNKKPARKCQKKYWWTKLPQIQLSIGKLRPRASKIKPWLWSKAPNWNDYKDWEKVLLSRDGRTTSFSTSTNQLNDFFTLNWTKIIFFSKLKYKTIGIIYHFGGVNEIDLSKCYSSLPAFFLSSPSIHRSLPPIGWSTIGTICSFFMIPIIALLFPHPP